VRLRRAGLRYALAILAAALLVFAQTAAPQAGEERAAGVHALRLAGIAERIAKLHVQAGRGVLPERSRRALPDAVRDFDATLRAAGARRPGDAESRDNYLLLGLLWREYRPWASRPPTRDSVRKVADRADEVAWIAAKAPRLQGAGPLALEASRACVLSQRVPRLHFMRHWEPRNAELARELEAASAELSAILARLAAAEQNTVDIAAQLQIAQTQHGFLASAGDAMHRPGATPRHAENVAKTGDHILESMERAARLYDEARL
jgi:hypothetical protein